MRKALIWSLQASAAIKSRASLSSSKSKPPQIFRDLKIFRTAIGLFPDELFKNEFVALVAKLTASSKQAGASFEREHFYPLFMDIMRTATMEKMMQFMMLMVLKGGPGYDPNDLQGEYRLWMLRFQYAYITLRRASPLEPWLAKLSSDQEQTFKGSFDIAFGSTRLISHPHEFNEFWEKVQHER